MKAVVSRGERHSPPPTWVERSRRQRQAPHRQALECLLRNNTEVDILVNICCGEALHAEVFVVSEDCRSLRHNIHAYFETGTTCSNTQAQYLP
ncbi:hypothetical protein E2C01_086435 [Portunus trituberculatus]|uniref:Uncharacterized protein n=1 Tax=Portunus trituberculatus TaxID=210409 RepID=A0A5B7J3T1_PORTR|nr:hypothetical protein [Portunus trituberculatus]